MIEGLRFVVPGTQIIAWMAEKSVSALKAAEEARIRHEAYKELEGKLGNRDKDCHPKIQEECIGKSDEQRSDQWKSMMAWIVADETYSLSSSEVNQLMDIDSYHNTSIEASSRNW